MKLLTSKIFHLSIVVAGYEWPKEYNVMAKDINEAMEIADIIIESWRKPDCRIKEIKELYEVRYKSTKTVTVEL